VPIVPTPKALLRVWRSRDPTAHRAPVHEYLIAALLKQSQRYAPAETVQSLSQNGLRRWVPCNTVETQDDVGGVSVSNGPLSL